MNTLDARALADTLAQTSWTQSNAEAAPWRACLCELSARLNPQGKSYKIVNALPHEPERFDQTDFLNAMANIGYYARQEQISIDKVDERLMPCLYVAHGAVDEPLILLGKGQIFNGQSQAVEPVPEKKVRGEAWFFQPYNEDKAATSKTMRAGTRHSWFTALIGRFKGTLWEVLALGLVLNTVALLTPLYIMLVYDRVISTRSDDIIPMLAAGVASGLLLEWMLRCIRSQHLSVMAARLDNIVSKKIFDHLIHLAPGYIERASVPSQVARIKTFEAVRDFFSGSVFLSMLELPFMVVALVAIAIVAGPLVLVPLLMAGLYLFLFYMIWRKVRVAIRVSAKAATARQQFSIEAIDKLEAINAAGLNRLWSQKFHDIAARDAIAAYRLSWLGIVGETLANSLTVLSAVVIVGLGVGMIWAGQMTTGALVATMILVWRILTPFYSLCTMIPRLDQLRNSILQVNRLVDIDTEATTHRAAARLEAIKGRVSFVNVSMRYSPEGSPLFSGLTFEALPGDIVAITGTNGSGKSSLLKMVKGMYVPTTGSVRIDGFDIRQLDPLDLRRHIAYIPQNTSFFHGTIAENLRFSNPLAGTREIEIALGQAGVLNDIRALPEGLNTIIGGDGNLRLSSSLELRLAMVRAYLHDSSILLIDELPNSLLSEEAGTFLRDHLLRYRRKRTVIMVTHREDFMNMADTIVVMQRDVPPQVGPRAFMLGKLRTEQW